jgi:hypothetical protein
MIAIKTARRQLADNRFTADGFEQFRKKNSSVALPLDVYQLHCRQSES